MLRLKTYEEFKNKIVSNIYENKIDIFDKNKLCLKSNEVSNRIFNFLKKKLSLK